MARPGRVMLGALIVAAVLLSSAVLHEAGHILAGRAIGMRLDEVAVMPGIRLYPTVERVPWSGWVAHVAQSSDHPVSPLAKGFRSLMGSGTNTIISYIAMALLWWRRPGGMRLFAMGVTVLVLAGDIVGYGVLPRLGLRHAIFVGGKTTEPRLAAMRMGLPGWAFDVLLAIHCAVVLRVLYLRCLRARPASTQTGPVEPSRASE